MRETVKIGNSLDFKETVVELKVWNLESFKIDFVVVGMVVCKVVVVERLGGKVVGLVAVVSAAVLSVVDAQLTRGWITRYTSVRGTMVVVVAILVGLASLASAVAKSVTNTIFTTHGTSLFEKRFGTSSSRNQFSIKVCVVFFFTSHSFSAGAQMTPPEWTRSKGHSKAFPNIETISNRKDFCCNQISATSQGPLDSRQRTFPLWTLEGQVAFWPEQKRCKKKLIFFFKKKNTGWMHTLESSKPHSTVSSKGNILVITIFVSCWPLYRQVHIGRIKMTLPLQLSVQVHRPIAKAQPMAPIFVVKQLLIVKEKKN